MIVPTMGRLQCVTRANNAAFKAMNASNSLLNLTSFAGSTSLTSKGILATEQRLMMDMLQNSLLYKLNLLQEQSLKKLADKNIERTFSTFA